MHELTKRVDERREFAVPPLPYIPAIRSTDGTMEFVSLVKERELLEIRKLAEKGGIPQLESRSTEFMMHMLDNVIGQVTLPLITHIQILKRGMQTLGAAVDDITDFSEDCIRKAAKTPAFKHVETLRLVRQSLYEAAAKLVSAEENAFSWRGPGFVPPLPPCGGTRAVVNRSSNSTAAAAAAAVIK